MKNIKYKHIAFIAIAITVLIGCKKKGIEPEPDPQPSALEERLVALKNNNSSWVLSGTGVEKDGYDVTDQFAGFKITIGENTYTTQNGLASAWPASGTWEFNNGDVNSIKRDDGVIISTSLSGTSLTLSFSVSGLSGGRADGIDGQYIFNLISE